MPDYTAIYNDVYMRVDGYRNPLTSPGIRTTFRFADLIRSVGPRHLDVGCGLGFVVEALRKPPFRKSSYGVDVSDVACNEANQRLGQNLAQTMVDAKIPHANLWFDLVTCFDVLEHLDECDILNMKAEILRVLKRGALCLVNISLRESLTKDMHGNSVHRTVRPAQWWDEIFRFDRYEVDKADMELTGIFRRPPNLD